MPTFQFAGTAQATCRVLNLWNGSSNNTPPTGYTLPGFDDSAWPLSSVPDLSAASPRHEYVSEGIQAIAPWVSPPNAHAAFAFRFHFTAPANPPWNHYQWDFQTSANNLAGATVFAINGTEFVGRSFPNVNAGYYNYGADNVLAGYIDMSPGPTTWAGASGWAAFRNTFYIPNIGSIAYAWGTVTAGVNDKGFMGVGDTTTHLRPTVCAGVPGNVSKIVSNGKTTMFLTNDGHVYVCGDNSTGLLGIGSTDFSAHATPAIIGLSDIADISIGQDCAMAIRSDGELYMWGPNAAGSLGRGNTTAQLSPQIQLTTGTVLGFGNISAGKNFAVAVDGTTGNIYSAGDNTYGQLGQGTAGAAVTSWNTVLTGDFPIGYAVTQISAGDDQTVLRVFDPSSSPGSDHVFTCGRAEYGSLSGIAYAAGTGIHHIVTSLIDAGVFAAVEVQQAGPLTFARHDDGSSSRFTFVYGDGVPYGGAGDDDGTTVYGTGIVAQGRVSTPVAPFHSKRLADTGGGSNNPYASGNSKAVFGAIGDDDLLYTWGWGDAGQMGSGADATTNIDPISVNGLTNIIGAAVCAAGMFAIAAVATVQLRGRGYVAVIG